MVHNSQCSVCKTLPNNDCTLHTLRQVTFRSQEHAKGYFEHCSTVLGNWRDNCLKIPLSEQYLEPESDSAVPGCPEHVVGNELEHPHGIYLFKHRNKILRYFAPNFHPPYSSPESREVILQVLKLK